MWRLGPRPGSAARRSVVAGTLLVAGLLGWACSSGTPDEALDQAMDPSATPTDGAGDDTTAPVDAAAVEAAERFCPILWDWVKAVGEAFNQAADDVAGIADTTGRRDRWERSFVEIEGLNDDLGLDLAPLADDPLLGPLVAEVERDLPRSATELADIRQLFVDHPELDEERHQLRTSQVVVRIEKVIDVAKPDLLPLDTDGALLLAFRQVPACQHAVRDVDDGNTQANG